MTHRAAQASLARYLAKRYERTRPFVFEELALAGRYADRGRLDVVALWIGAGYRRVTVHGYEVKVTRSDLLGDLRSKKYERYLGQVDRLYFALDEGAGDAADIPPGYGVLLRRGAGDAWVEVRGARKLDRPHDPTLPWRLLYRLRDQLTRRGRVR